MTAQASHLRPYAWPMLRGLAGVAATSLAAALTVTADLLRLSYALQQTGATAPTLATRLVGTALGTFGPQAAFAVFGALFTVAGLAAIGLAEYDSRQAKVGHAIASSGLGLLLSPFWLVAASGGLAAAAPGLLIACGGVVGLQGLAARLERKPALSPLTRLAAATALAAVAPVGAGIAIGLAPATSALGAVTTVALGLLGAANSLWLAYLAATDDRGDAELLRTRVPVNRAKRLSTPDEARPTVFVDDPELQKFVDALRAQRNAGAACDGLLLLHGAPGTGKSDTAQAIANLGPWEMFQAPFAALFDAPAPQAVLMPWFEQLRTRARRTGRTQVAFFDEAELLLRSPGAPGTGGRARGLVNAAADLFGELQLKGSNVLVVVGTNHPGRLAAKVQQRFVGGSLHACVHVAPPGPASLGRMVATKLVAAHGHYRGLRAVGPFAPDAKFVAEAGEALARLGAVGRDVASGVDEALTEANAAFGARWRRLQQPAFDAFVARSLRRRWRMAEFD